jgi:exosortase D (VPLPA-CTERM-specific)
MKKVGFSFSNTAVSRDLLLGLLALIFLIIAAFPIVSSLIATWGTEEYSHGYLIPVLAFLFGWNRLAEKKPILSPSWWGVAVLILGFVLMIVAKLSAFEPPSFYGLILFIVAISLATFGRAATCVLLPAFIYLIFAIPLPRLIYVNLSQNLQLLSTTLGVFPLDLLGIPVLQEGNVIDLGDYKLQVVDACSGLRYLFPLMSFGYLVSYLINDRLWKRIVLFLSTIPIAIFMNSLRIAFIGITVDKWGKAAAEGILHDFEGWSVFLLCVLVLFGEAWILLRLGHKGHFRYDRLHFAKGPFFSGKRPRPVTATLLLSFLILAIMSVGVLDQRSEVKPAHLPLPNFPLILDDWHGQPMALGPDVLDALQLSDYFLAGYKRQGSKDAVEFYMAYYDSQRAGSSAHSPSNCLPGNGWEILSNATKTITLPDNQAVTVSRLLVRRGNDLELTYYWFDERGRDLTEQYSAKWYLLWDSMTMHRTDGGLVRLMTRLDPDQEAEADEKLTKFLSLIYPQLRKYIPDANETNIAVP